MFQKDTKKVIASSINLLALAVLFLSFSITVLSQQALTDAQRYIAYAYLAGAALYVIFSILPQSITHFMKNKYAIVLSYLAANLAWFFTFSMKWLEGITNTNDVEQVLLSLVGIIFLIAIIVIETRYLKELTKVRELGLILPLLILIFGTNSLVKNFNIWTLVYILIFVILGVLVVYTKWRPGGDLPFIPSKK